MESSTLHNTKSDCKQRDPEARNWLKNRPLQAHSSLIITHPTSSRFCTSEGSSFKSKAFINLMPKLNWYKTASKLTLAADTGLEQCSANEAPQTQLPPCRVLLGPQGAAKQVLECTLRNLVVVHYTMILRGTTYIVRRVKCSRSLPSMVVFETVCHYTVYVLLLTLPLPKYICIIYWHMSILCVRSLHI